MLEKLAENHNLWIKMVINMGCDKHIAEDIVQSMYLRIHRLVTDEKKIMYNDDDRCAPIISSGSKLPPSIIIIIIY